jgi:hypothetical protein
MKRTTLLSAALAIAVIAAATPAFAMRDPGAGGMAMYNYGPQPPRVGQTALNNQYADGVNLYQYVQSSPIQRMDPFGLQGWGRADFVAHYYAGGGRAVTLNEVGLFFTFVNAPDVKRSVESFKSKVRVKIAKAVSDGFLKCKDGKPDAEDYWMWGKDTDVTDVRGQIFSVGKSTFHREYDCKLKINKCDCDTVMDWGYSCRLQFGIDDSFSDPLGVGVEPGGTPYGISVRWDISLNSNYKIERPIRFRIPRYMVD